jgi:hypothetical protein
MGNKDCEVVDKRNPKSLVDDKDRRGESGLNLNHADFDRGAEDSLHWVKEKPTSAPTV